MILKCGIEGKTMDLLELKYLVEVANAGSFTRAAVTLDITQPGLSRHILKLESELRTKLFYRHGRGVILTQNGRKLVELVKPLLTELAEVKQEILEQGDSLSGPVTIGVPPSIGNTLASSLARAFAKNCPNAALRIDEAFSGTLMEWIEAGRLDLAILYDARRSQNLIVTPLLLESFYLIQPAGKRVSKPVAIEELSKRTLVLPNKENGFRRVIDAAARRANVNLTVTMEVDSISALKQLVEGRDGCTILPYGAAYREVREGRLSAQWIKSPDMCAMLVTTTPLHRPISKTTQALLRLVHAEVKRCIASGILRGQVPSGTINNNR
jgi:LysR family nitrogen assimilation transcriptional regulator